jgi:hypothetical protein
VLALGLLLFILGAVMILALSVLYAVAAILAWSEVLFMGQKAVTPKFGPEWFVLHAIATAMASGLVFSCQSGEEA